eukprot:gene25738-biopygen1483
MRVYVLAQRPAPRTTTGNGGVGGGSGQGGAWEEPGCDERGAMDEGGRRMRVTPDMQCSRARGSVSRPEGGRHSGGRAQHRPVFPGIAAVPFQNGATGNNELVSARARVRACVRTRVRARLVFALPRT